MDFEQHRDHLYAVAFRILGSRSDADDAVHEAWLRMNRSDVTGIANPRGWLTTVVARVSLDVLRARATRREAPLDDTVDVAAIDDGPEELAVLADSVGVALMVVLQALGPTERLALVLHDVFDVPFAEIGSIIGRSANATAQLAVRARRRVRGQTHDPDVTTQRQLVDAFLAAARDGEFDALVGLLDPDVELATDVAAGGGVVVSVLGAHEVASRASLFAGNARYAEVALVDGAPAILVAPDGRVKLLLRFAFRGRRIVGITILAEPHQLDALDIGLFG